MSRETTCALCGRPVDDSQTIEMPNGIICIDPCYKWLESMMEQADDTDDANEGVTIIYVEIDE